MFLKLSDECPEVRVRRLPQQTKHSVIVNDRRIPRFGPSPETNGDWSRKIYIDEDSEVVVKIDTYGYHSQCRNEAVMWTERLQDLDKEFFAPVLGIGNTTLIEQFDKSMKVHPGYYIVQELIVQEEYNFRGATDIPIDIYRMAKDVADKYDITDMSERQMKINTNGKIKIHDYGIYNHEPVPSSKIPDNPKTFRNRLSSAKI